ncbi:MAG: glycosyltransferase family 39 protein [Anaerolineales bacterium]
MSVQAENTVDRERAERWKHLVPALIPLLGIAWIGYVTILGPGVGGDSAIYLASAHNIVQGTGLGLVEPGGEFRSLPYSAPLFPLVLAGMETIGLDPVAGARWMNALLFGVLIFLTQRIVARVSGSWLPPALVGALLVFSPALFPVFSWAMAEPLFLCCGVASLMAGQQALRGGKDRWWAATGLAAGAAFLARYVGVVFFATPAAAWLFSNDVSWPRKIRGLAILLGLGATPMAIWVVSTFRAGGGVGSRSWETWTGFTVRLPHAWVDLQKVSLSWAVPFSWAEAPPYPVSLNSFLAVVLWASVLLGPIATYAYFRDAVTGEGSESLGLALRLLSVFTPMYLLVVGLVFATTYPPITLDNRMLSPAHWAWLIWLALLGPVFARVRPDTRWLGRGIVIGLAVLAISYFFRGARMGAQIHADGLGFHSRAWQSSATIQAVRHLPADTPLITNEVTALLFLTGRAAYAMPEIYQRPPGSPPPSFGAADGDAVHRLFREGAALVLFDSLAEQFNEVRPGSGEDWRRLLTEGLTIGFDGADGAIYFYSMEGSR